MRAQLICSTTGVHETVAPLVSVIIPTYNRPDALQSCLGALAMHTLAPKSLEVVVVDDGSPQPLALDPGGWGDSFTLKIVRQENTGPAGARNRGVEEARGEFLAFTDDDCLPAPQWLARLVTALQENPDALIGGSTCNGLKQNIYSETSQLIVTMVYEHFNNAPSGAYFFASNNFACSRNAYQTAGGFDTDFPVPGAEDREFCDRWRTLQRPLIWQQAALVEHRHPQTLRKFVNLHYRYGRGAYLYQAKRRARNSGTMAEDMGFHRSLIRRIFRRLSICTLRKRIGIVSLLITWQIVNTLGFFRELMNSPRNKYVPGGLFAADITIVNCLMYLTKFRLIWQFKTTIGYWPKIAAPTTFEEKILWRKLFDHNPLFVTLADKLTARQWMKERWPTLRIARTLWTGGEAARLPPDVVQHDVVIKVNHGSGMNLVMPQPSLSHEEMVGTVATWLSLSYDRRYGEWAYGWITRKVFVEEKICSRTGTHLVDYNFYCCDGEIIFFIVTVGEKTEHEAVAYYRPDGTRDRACESAPYYEKNFLPAEYALSPVALEGVAAASAISRGLDFVRVDLMEVDAQLYAGEMTLYPNAGYGSYTRLAIMKELSSAWDLGNSWFLASAGRSLMSPYARTFGNTIHGRSL